MIEKAVFNNNNGTLELLCSECGKVVLSEPDFNATIKYAAKGVTSLSPMYCHDHLYMGMYGKEKSREMRKRGIQEKLREGIMKKNVLNIAITRPNQELVIMRGVPGAGKSTEVNKLIGEGVVHSTDTLIEMRGDGAYAKHFATMVESGDWSAHSRVHHQNFLNAKAAMFQGVSPVIVDNTNIKANEPKKYVKAALEMGLSEANIKVVDVGYGGCTAEVLAERNTHNVPLATIKKMMSSHRGVGPLTVKKILESKDMYKKSEKILYSAVVLDDESQTALAEHFAPILPEGWKIFCHHMTIVFGKGLEDKGEVGKEVELTVTELGSSDMAIAVKVDGYPTTNNTPHITIAINVAHGGTPVMAKKITDWSKVDLGNTLKLYGTVTEVTP
jgi:predicted kinase